MTTPTGHVNRSRSLIMKYPGGAFAYRHPRTFASLESVVGIWLVVLAAILCSVATGGERRCSWWRRCPSGLPTTSFSRSGARLQDARRDAPCTRQSSHPIPANFRADLARCYSMVRSKWRR